MKSKQAELVPLATAAAGVPVTDRTLRRWANEGLRGRRLTAVRIGGRLFASRRAVAKFIAGCNEREAMAEPVGTVAAK